MCLCIILYLPLFTLEWLICCHYREQHSLYNCVGQENRTLHSANLGDSGFIVIREGTVVHESSEQQHYFNTPYQLAIPPPGQEGAVIQDR